MRERLSNSTIIGLSIICVILFVCLCTLVYGDKNTEYKVDDIQVICLFESEQEIIKDYQMNTDMISESVEDTLIVGGIDSSGIDNTEQMTVDVLSSLKVYEFEEEYITNNRLSARNINSYKGIEGFIWPVPGHTYISSPYGWRICPFHGYEFHYGIDIPAPEGTSIKACKDGEVVISKYSDSYGYYMRIDHTDGTQTLYAHMVRQGLPEGTIVKQGDEIGGIGSTGDSTGNHLHFEIRATSDINSKVDPLSKFIIE